MASEQERLHNISMEERELKRSEQVQLKQAKRAEQVQLKQAKRAEQDQVKQAEQDQVKQAKRAEQVQLKQAKRAEQDQVKQAKRAEQDQVKQAKRAEQDQVKQAKQAKRAEQDQVKQAKRAEQVIVTEHTIREEDILVFFQGNTRAENDAANKTRERILGHIVHRNPFPEHPQWIQLHRLFQETILEISRQTNVPPYTSVTLTNRGGRRFHYDFTLSFHNEDQCVADRSIEFKNGADAVHKLPQFLSVPTGSMGGFDESYASFYYQHFLDEYLHTDRGITEQKPTWIDYAKSVKKISDTHPFFVQLKERETIEFVAKKRIVNQSIASYLEKFALTSNCEFMRDKIHSSQSNKMYVLWKQHTFHVQRCHMDTTDFRLDRIHNKNTIVYASAGMLFHALLRWRNHAGILNPAWQISIKNNSI